ncbi:MAG: tetratricopeptide repeat protein, partial [Planctomycetes bacterium]|nr:tetratricopeptide repeat protein [Planctomycetota bacterium]
DMKKPFDWRQITIPKDDFNLELIGGKKNDTSATDIAISDYLVGMLQALKLKSRVVVGPEFIEIEWFPDESSADPFESAITLLRKGKYDEGVFLLRAVIESNPDDIDALYNLGMALSDMGQTEQAIEYLSRATNLAPEFTNAHIALGVAYVERTDSRKHKSLLRKPTNRNPIIHSRLAILPASTSKPIKFHWRSRFLKNP